MEWVVPKLAQIVNTKLVPKGVYTKLRRQGLVKGVPQTKFIRAFRSLETDDAVKHYLLSSYLDDANKLLITRDVIRGYDWRQPMYVTLKNKKLVFVNPITQRAITRKVRFYEGWYSHRAKVLGAVLLSNDGDLNVVPFIDDFLRWVSWLTRVNRACGRYLLSLAFDYPEDEKKILDDSKFIKGIGKSDDYKKYYKAAKDGLEKVSGMVERFNDSDLSSAYINTLNAIDEVINELDILEDFLGTFEDETQAKYVLTKTHDMETALNKMADRLLEADYSKFDTSDLRKNFRMPFMGNRFMTTAAKTTSAARLKFVAHKIKPE